MTKRERELTIKSGPYDPEVRTVEVPRILGISRKKVEQEIVAWLRESTDLDMVHPYHRQRIADAIEDREYRRVGGVRTEPEEDSQ